MAERRFARRSGVVAVAAGGLLLGLGGAALPAGAQPADPHVVARGMSGVVPARGTGGAGSTPLLTWHSGPVQHGSAVQTIFWGTSWSATNSKVTGLGGFYTGLGGTKYMGTNTEYTDGAGNVSSAVTYLGPSFDSNAAPKHAPQTSAVLNVVSAVTGGHPQAGAYYPVYSDQPRGHAGYCAWHSSGTINGIEVQFGFFFNLDGDPGCDPQSPYAQSQGLAALGNVSGHEISEMVTDPQLNAWYDSSGSENADKCAWTFSGKPVVIGGQDWKIQGNFSNAAYGTSSGYDGAGCIDGT